MDPKMPPVLWGALYALGVVTLLLLFSAIFQPSGGTTVTVILNLVLLFGIYHGHRWAFILTVGSAALGTILLLSHDVALGLVGFLINAMVVVPLILARRYFFVPRGAITED